MLRLHLYKIDFVFQLFYQFFEFLCVIEALLGFQCALEKLARLGLAREIERVHLLGALTSFRVDIVRVSHCDD